MDSTSNPNEIDEYWFCGGRTGGLSRIATHEKHGFSFLSICCRHKQGVIQFLKTCTA
jgi:hypothetical protein